MLKHCVSGSENSAYRDDGALAKCRDMLGFGSILRARCSELKALLCGRLLRVNIGSLSESRGCLMKYRHLAVLLLTRFFPRSSLLSISSL
jgi:hypothetical protein